SHRVSSGANVRAVRSQRRASSAQFLAVAMSHAEGFSGTPRNFQTSIARQNASCTTSSASARFWTPKMRVTAATRRPNSRRKRCSSGSIRRGVRRFPSHVQVLNRPNLHGAVDLEDRAALGELHGLLEIAGLDQRIPANDVLGLGKRPIDHGHPLALHDLAVALEGLATVLQVTLPRELFHPRHPFLEHLLRPLRAHPGLATSVEREKLAHTFILLLRSSLKGS